MANEHLQPLKSRILLKPQQCVKQPLDGHSDWLLSGRLRVSEEEASELELERHYFLQLVDGRATVYVCHSYTCSPPATTWDEIAPLLVTRAR